jgi:hypothetical protein
MSQWKDEFSFVNGCVVDKEYILFLLANDELAARKIDSAMFLGWKGGAWLNGGDQDWMCAGIGIERSETPKLVAVGEFGEVFVKGGGVQINEKVTPKLKTISDRGPLRGVRTIDQNVYVVGMDRQVYMRSKGRWSAFDAGLNSTHGNSDIAGFEAIAGFDKNELYAVGWNGEIWRFDGHTWKRADSPSNLILNDVCCAADGKVYAVGQKGTLLVGRHDKWQLISGAWLGIRAFSTCVQMRNCSPLTARLWMLLTSGAKSQKRFTSSPKVMECCVQSVPKT